MAPELYPTWPDTVKFAQGIRQRILEDTEESERNTWNTNLKIVEEIAERYGRWQDKECHVLKGMLLEMEKGSTGRVQLEDFYAPALHNQSWQFVESVPYLQQLGALDETSSSKKSVIIPNYINSPANCVASSKFYSVCCIDQCEDLLSTLENKIAAPDATPAQILEIVSALPSDTVQVPRALPASLAQRLHDIAAHHGGVVPLHGRLFAQWLHHAYPRECEYPHMSGTTNPLTQEEWLERSSQPLNVGKGEIRQLLDESRLSGNSVGADGSPDQSDELPWLHEEELFVRHHKLQEPKGQSVLSRVLMFLGVPLSLMAWALSRAPTSAKSKAVLSPEHKYYV
jgi:diadenosine tetraphosphatase ApaH/serine/threonine PP2A family protein phosphatase